MKNQPKHRTKGMPRFRVVTVAGWAVIGLGGEVLDFVLTPYTWTKQMEKVVKAELRYRVPLKEKL